MAFIPFAPMVHGMVYGMAVEIIIRFPKRRREEMTKKAPMRRPN
jgi:hypothetical protein